MEKSIAGDVGNGEAVQEKLLLYDARIGRLLEKLPCSGMVRGTLPYDLGSVNELEILPYDDDPFGNVNVMGKDPGDSLVDNVNELGIPPFHHADRMSQEMHLVSGSEPVLSEI